MQNSQSIAVALLKCPRYDPLETAGAVGTLFEAVGFRPKTGSRVLVKPNLLCPQPPDHLTCTNPVVVRSVCEYLLDHGALVRIGDSPTFGKTTVMAGKIGLESALEGLPVSLVNFDRARSIRFSCGPSVGIAREVLDSDHIVSLPKLKAHHQMGITAAIKNVYGCVVGVRKPILHLLHGDRNCRFEQMLLELWQHIPPSVSLMDAVTAMHVHGPTKGEPYPLGLLGASCSPVALDTSVLSILGLHPEGLPLWKAAIAQKLPGSRLDDLFHPLESPESFDSNGFRVPELLYPISFRPLRVIGHYIKRFRMQRCGGPNAASPSE